MQNIKCIYNEQNSVIKHINSSKLSNYYLVVCLWQCDDVRRSKTAWKKNKLNVICDAMLLLFFTF